MRMSIGFKILSIFGVAALFSLLGAAVSYRGTGEMVSSSEWVVRSFEARKELRDILSDLKDAETGQRGFLITGEDHYLEPYKSALSQLDRNITEAKEITSDNPNQQARLVEIKSVTASRLAEIAETIRIRREQGFEAARKIVLTDRGKISMDRLKLLLNEAIAEEDSLRVKRTALSLEYAAETRKALVIAGALSIALLLFMAYFVNRNIIAPLSRVVRMANAIAEGNLKHEKLPIFSQDEIGELSRVFNVMLDSLRELATQNNSISKNLAAAATEVLASIQQQAAATKQQATAIQETTTTMEEISQSGTQISERAREVVNSAASFSESGESGLAAVQSTNRTMVGVREQVENVAENIVTLSERNQAIAEIIATVNDIAEQSNLLALNAAIEAAAAGEQGRSFSVVASEIKNLAEQAKESTVQVRSILSDIQKGINSSVMLTEEAVKRAESGKQLSDVAERTIRELTLTTKQSIGTFQQIVGATNQQQIGFEQITQALKNIRQGAEQTAASTNQLEKAAMSMNSLGQQLQKSTERYQF